MDKHRKESVSFSQTCLSLEALTVPISLTHPQSSSLSPTPQQRTPPAENINHVLYYYKKTTIPQFLRTPHLKAMSHEASIHLAIHRLFNLIFFSSFYSFRKLSNLPNVVSLIILQPFKSWYWETDIPNQFTVLTAS